MGAPAHLATSTHPPCLNAAKSAAVWCDLVLNVLCAFEYFMLSASDPCLLLDWDDACSACA